MVYTGKAECKKHGEFEWQIVKAEKNKVIGGKDLINKYVKDYDEKSGLVIAYCPKCSSIIEITDYKFDKN